MYSGLMNGFPSMGKILLTIAVLVVLAFGAGVVASHWLF
jgi:hypothetical protein